MTYLPVCPTSTIPLGEKKRFVVNEREVCVYHLQDGFFATDNICSHARASLAEGRIVDEEWIECPRHGSQFSIKTGTVMSLPAFEPIRTFPVKIENDTILVDVPEPKTPHTHENA